MSKYSIENKKKQCLHRTRKLQNIQTERKIFKYANCPRLQIKRTGLSSGSVQLVRPAGPFSWSVQLVCSVYLAGLFSWSVQLVRPDGITSRPIYTLHPTCCILCIASYALHLTHCIIHVPS